MDGTESANRVFQYPTLSYQGTLNPRRTCRKFEDRLISCIVDCRSSLNLALDICEQIVHSLEPKSLGCLHEECFAFFKYGCACGKKIAHIVVAVGLLSARFL